MFVEVKKGTNNVKVIRPDGTHYKGVEFLVASNDECNGWFAWFDRDAIKRDIYKTYSSFGCDASTIDLGIVRSENSHFWFEFTTSNLDLREDEVMKLFVDNLM